MYRPQSKYQSNLETGEKFSTLAVNVLTLSGFVALIFGVFITRDYLSSIQQTAIFPDILTSPSALLALLVVFTVACSLIVINLITPYHIPNLLEQDYKNQFNNIKNKLYFNLFIGLDILFLFLLIISFVFYKKTFWVNFNILISIGFVLLFALSVIFYILNRYLIIEKIKNTAGKIKIYYVISYLLILLGLYYQSLLLCIVIIYFMRLIFYYFRMEEISTLIIYKVFYLVGSLFFYLTVYSIYNTDNFAFIGFITLWICIYAINGYLALNFFKAKNVNWVKYVIILIWVFLLNYFLFLFDKNNQLSRLILKPLHFIEYPSNANWYTIDTRFFAPNNLTISELESNSNNLKQYFNYKTERTLDCNVLY